VKTTSNCNLHESEIIYELPDNTPARYSANGTFLFAAYGCIVTERQTAGGMYVYTAVNLTNGKSEILSRRKTRLAKSGFGGMAANIRELPICGDGVLNADKKPDECAGIDSLTKILNHIFKEILPQYGYAVRGKQIELAEHMLEVTRHRGVTLAESEVGTGKTHAYLVAAALAKRGRLNDFWLRGHYPRQSWAESAYMPAVISTSSIALQNAVVKDYIPQLSEILMRHGVIRSPLTAAVRKGREHYICEQRLQRFHQTTDEPTKALLNPFTGASAPFDLTGADSLSPHMKRRICVSGKCGGNCPHTDRCRYIRHLKRINNPSIDFQITNHNYFLADVLHRVGGKCPLLPHYQLVIIDEAHKFLQAARSMHGLELTDSELPELAQEIHAFAPNKSNSGVNVHRLAKKLKEQNEKIFQYINDNISENDSDEDLERLPAVLDGTTGNLFNNIADTVGKLAAIVTDSRVSKFYEERQSAAVWKLSNINEKVCALRKPDSLIHWLEKSASKADALCAIPKNLNVRLYQDLWSKGIPVVLTSGTLSASGDFTRIKQTLGLERMPEHKLFTTTKPSPFDYKNNSLIYISENVPYPDNNDKRYIVAVADEIERLVTASHGHAAVLFTSYNAMGKVHAILQNRRLPFPMFRLERGGVQAIERFKKSGNGVLLASGALWEGIDIPGDTLSMLIIVRLPFAVPDPIGDYELSLCGGDMGIYKQRVIKPDMQVRLKQGGGRLLRVETDTGVIAILDIRANRYGAYHRWALEALPECRVTSDIKAVRGFYEEKKSRGYFMSII
jgi:ATP-dependent DNA helicase DinG